MTSRRGVHIARACAAIACILGLASSVRADSPKKESVTIAGQRASVWASSTLESPKEPERYAAKNAFDGDIHTAWVEGAKGPGVGESLHIEFEHPVTVRGFAIWPGYMKSFKTLRENLLPTSVDLAGGSGDLALSQLPLLYGLKSKARWTGMDQIGPCDQFAQDPENLGPRVVVLAKPWVSTTFALTLAKATPNSGTRYDDTAVSEWTLIGDADHPWYPAKPYAAATHLLELLARGENVSSSSWLAPNAKVDDVSHFERKGLPSSYTFAASIKAIKKYLAVHKPQSSSGDALADLFVATHDLWVTPSHDGGTAAYASFMADADSGSVDLLGQPVSVDTDDGPAAFWPSVHFDQSGRITFAGLVFSNQRGTACDMRLPAN